MSSCETALHPVAQPAMDGSAEWRNDLACALWMIDHHGSTILRCRCLDSNPSELRLRVPLGYGVGVGQRYEVCSHLPGQRPAPEFGLIGSAWVTIAEAHVLVAENDDHLDVRAVRDPLAA